MVMMRGVRRRAASWSGEGERVESARAERGPQIRVDEVVSHKKQWFVVGLRQRVGKTIAKVEVSAVPAAAPISSTSFTADSRLLSGDRFDDDFEICDQAIKHGGVSLFWQAIHHDGGFQQPGRRHVLDRCSNERLEASFSLRFLEENRQDR